MIRTTPRKIDDPTDVDMDHGRPLVISVASSSMAFIPHSKHEAT
jgi:hypothetical protein